MARSNGRDITLSLVSDTSRFDPDNAARDLERLGDAAEDAGRALDDIDSSGLRRVGADARHAADEADESFGDIKDAGRGAAQEVAGSFDGSIEGIVGGFQGAAAEAGASMGGIAGGALLALGMATGVVMSKVSEASEKAKERIEGIADRIRDLQGAANGLDSSKLRDFVNDLDSDEVSRFTKDAEKLGVTVEDIARARYGEKDAVEKVTAAYDELKKANDQFDPDTESWIDNQLNSFDRWAENVLGMEEDIEVAGHTMVELTDGVSAGTRQLAEETRAATEAEEARTAALGGLTEAQTELNDSLRETFEGIVDSSDDVENAASSSTESVIAAAKAQADATEDMSDTWADYASNSAKAADEIIAEQNRQLAELQEFQTNTQAVLEQGGEDLVAWANSQTDAPAAMAIAAKMTPEQAKQIGDNYRTTVELAGEDMVKGTEKALDKTINPAGRKGEQAGKAYADGVVKGIQANQSKIDKAAKASYPQPYNGSWTNSPGKKVP